ncbi:hypothetical protein CBR_g48845 [Chara braunii]|uniref:t-SNARE coiled-coil homology domain-containing protein n=1 Tax=Chara braunii TaxID=69332 RepID=A0A388M3H1_CHABU|nr:hypothetical protein CBR_g48845 [Chara braunii]|eukprot:GBG89138.1 hypothetical protein CBR_g48845 [Chara braunii]
MSEELEGIENQLKDLFKQLSSGFQKLEKLKDQGRQARQLEELTGKLRECKRLIMEFDREIKAQEASNPESLTRELNDTKQSMIKELNGYVSLKKTYASTSGGGRAGLGIDGGGAGEDGGEAFQRKAAMMSTEELKDHGRKVMDNTDQAIESAQKIVHQTVNIGAQVAITTKGQTEQMKRVINELDDIHFSIKRATKLVKEIGRQVATDRCIMAFLVLIVLPGLPREKAKRVTTRVLGRNFRV